MEVLLKFLPKDLVNIIEEYAKDRTQYNKVIDELEQRFLSTISRVSSSLTCANKAKCKCYKNSKTTTYKTLIVTFPECYKKKLKLITKAVCGIGYKRPWFYKKLGLFHISFFWLFLENIRLNAKSKLNSKTLSH